MHELTCGEVADSAPGFALDILEPEVRSSVAAHLIRCPECRRTVSGMQESAAELLGGGVGPGDGSAGDAPAADSGPAGYVNAPLRPGRRRFRAAATMAAAAVLLVGSTFGPELAQSSHSADALLTVPLLAGSRTVGAVRLYASPPAIALEAQGLDAAGPLGVVLESSDGTAVRIGEAVLDHGHAAWLGRNPLRSGHPTGLVLVDGALHQVASAALAPTG